MADLSITASSVLPTGTTEFDVVTAGDTITAGMVVYSDTSDGGDHKKAWATSEATAKASGIAMCNASDGQKMVIATSGSITLGSVMTAGEAYGVSPAIAGNIAPLGDLESSDFATRLGVATSSSNLRLSLFSGNTEIATP